MKYCARCDTSKPKEEFYNNKSMKDGKDNTCKKCRKSIRRYDKPYAYKKALHANRKFVQDQKKPCVKCGWFEHPAGIDWHHLDASEKSFALASAGGRKRSDIIKEIEKCVCLCACCHRMLHAGIIELT